MNRTPRTLNRVLLGLLGLLCVAAGAHLVLVCLVPAYAGWVKGVLAEVDASRLTLMNDTRSPGRDASWLWLGLAVLAAVVLVLLVVWALVQGRGRVTLFSREAVREGDGRGVVEIAAAVPEQLLRQALTQRPDVLRVSISAWDQPGEAAGLRIKLQPRAGADPLRLVEDVDALVETLDERLGLRGPVVLELVSGARARLASAERVR
ncbi:hypothetical protein DWB68_02805 [Galactobacter valiniphilus]|uniref:Alkaline shock response membrane anchor protein AmaP n=1 Tax=Galactobacter valiniphilus TaxID=2676122 RepID=A0A399JDG5_9MICC|nr:hypothetical protein [Galactobacter valiniphilus]RII43254.1 hypothetical protein DWB68_02805 [Galactobacter valiniphilus]